MLRGRAKFRVIVKLCRGHELAARSARGSQDSLRSVYAARVTAPRPLPPLLPSQNSTTGPAI